MFGKKTTYVDLHCHVLPGMDDGAAYCKESIAMLEKMREDGCKGVAATPHYYCEESIAEFLERRANAYAALRISLQADESNWHYPILLGAEAAYRKGLAEDPGLEKLCFCTPDGKYSRYLLLEMPFSRWTASVLSDVREIVYTRNITPILAHLERYEGVTSEESIADVLDMDVIVQMNAGAVLRNKKKAVKMVRTGTAQVLGTDAHNLGNRAPNMADGLRVLNRNGLGKAAKELLQNNETIFANVCG